VEEQQKKIAAKVGRIGLTGMQRSLDNKKAALQAAEQALKGKLNENLKLIFWHILTGTLCL
jgi:hypothetical protein